ELTQTQTQTQTQTHTHANTHTAEPHAFAAPGLGTLMRVLTKNSGHSSTSTTLIYTHFSRTLGQRPALAGFTTNTETDTDSDLNQQHTQNTHTHTHNTHATHPPPP